MDLHEEEELNKSQDLVYSKAEIDRLIKQGDYLTESIDKLLERFNGMGRVMVENHGKLSAKIEENLVPRFYMVKPNKSEQIGNLALALSKAKTDFLPLEKTGSANRGAYSTIDDIERSVLKALEKHELAYSFLVGTNEVGEYAITLLLSHSSGQFLETSCLLNDHQAPTGTPFHQKIGSSEKYLRRYMLRSLLCLGEENE